MGSSQRSNLRPSRALLSIIGVLACLIPAAACVVSPGQSATSTTDQAGNTLSVAATVPRSSSEADVSAGESAGKVLQIMAACNGFDPAIDNSINDIATYGVALVSEVFSGLTALTGDSSPPFRNELLERYSVNDSGLAYDLVLRPDLTFSDGSALTAADVKWSWERAWRMSVAGGRARDVFGSIRGAEVGRKELPGVQLVDDSNLVVTLTALVPDFPMLLADPVAAVLKQDNVVQWGAAYTNGSQPTPLLRDHITQPELPIGAGPFAYSDFDWLTQDECSLVRNPHYHGAPPQIDSVRVISFRQVLEESTISTNPEQVTFGQHMTAQTRAFNERDIDFTLMPMEAADDGDIQDSGSRAVVRMQVERPQTQIVALNTASPPFDDINFRRAIATSWDIAGLFGEEQPRQPSRVIPPAIADSMLDASGYQFDPDLASRFLEESRYPLGMELEPVTLYYPYFGSFVDWLATVLGAWEDAVGLPVRVVSPDDSDWRAPRTDADPDLAFLTISAARPDSYGALSAVIASVSGDDPSAEWANALSQLDIARRTTDSALRKRLYVELEQHLLDTAMVIPYWTYSSNGPDATVAFIQPYVHGLQVPTFPRSVLQDVWLDDTAPVR